jgi:fructose/tagatose bisphosphate aldolase
LALITQASQAREIIKLYSDKKIPMPCFCAENTFTMEGILTGASRVAVETGTIPAIYIAVTANYHGRQQLKNYTSLNDTWEGYLAFKSDLSRLCRKGGPFSSVQVIPSLDHGQPGLDQSLINDGRDFWGCVMYDCSTLPLDENQDRVRRFVKQYRNDFVIEGCVDEITEAGHGGMKLTDPNDAKEFVDCTGCDLIVANLGTEHRVTGGRKKYHGELAQRISEKTGRCIVLHGTSCLSSQDLARLPGDGIAKVNIWTVLETKTTQKMLVTLIKQAYEILNCSEIRQLKDNKLLGEKIEIDPANLPKLKYLTEVYRRNSIKTPSIADIVYEFMKVFGY